MLLSLAAAFGAAVAFGAAAVLQAIGTAQTPTADGVDPRLLLLVLKQPAFLASLALDAAGFALHVTALHSLPLFLVQAVVASSVAVTAIVAVRLMHVPLTREKWTAIGVICVGLALLGPSAQTVEGTAPGESLRVALLVTVLVTAAAGVAAGHLAGGFGAVLLGLLGGVEFGVVAVAARLLPTHFAGLLTDLAAYVLVLAAGLALLLYATAMQRGTVTTTTAALVVTQTAVPAVLGIALLGDHVRPGYGPVAVVGFALALTGAATLSRLDRVSV